MTVTRKIGFYNLRLLRKVDKSVVQNPQEYIQNILNFIEQQPQENKKRMMGENRFYFLSKQQPDPGHIDTQHLIFKFADFGKLPPLIDETTLSERPNTRVMTEGDRHLTHTTIKYQSDEAIVLIECSRPAVTIKQLVRYLTFFDQELHHQKGDKTHYFLEDGIIPKGDFLSELENLKRINIGTITMSKKYLGSEFLGLSNSLSEVQKDIFVELKAKQRGNIKRLVEELFTQAITPDSKIQRLRVYGKDQSNKPVKLDTESIRKERFLEFTPNPLTGEVETKEMLNRLSQMIRDL